MQYEVLRKLTYMMHGRTHSTLVLQPGDVVKGVLSGGLDPKTASILSSAAKREAQRAMQHGGQARLLYFKAHGVVRYAYGVRELAPTRRQITIPVEATRVR